MDDSDATWARDSVVHQISNNWRAVATNKGVQFLELRHLFQGREMCLEVHALGDPLKPPSPTTSDWARFLNMSAVHTQGDPQETFHRTPTAAGVRAMPLSGLRADGQPVVPQPAATGPDGVLRPPSSSAALVAALGR